MSYSLLIRPEARAEIESGFDWYQVRRAGLGFEFETCLEDVFARILRDPESYAVIFDDIRRVPLKRFPYGVFYRVRHQQVAVLAVFHCRRDVRTVKQRH